MENTPFSKRLEQAKKYLEKAEKEQERLNASAIPGPYVTGFSGISRAYSKRLDRQLDRTIDLAKKVRYWREKVASLELKDHLYRQRAIDYQGRRIRPQKPKRQISDNRRQQIEAEKKVQILCDDLWCYGQIQVGDNYLNAYWEWDDHSKDLYEVVYVTPLQGRQYRIYKASGQYFEDLQRDLIRELMGLKFQPKKRGEVE